MGDMRNCMISVVVVLASDYVCFEPQTNKTVNGHNSTGSLYWYIL